MSKQKLLNQNKIMREALSRIVNASIDDVPEKDENENKYAYLCGRIQAIAEIAIKDMDNGIY